MSASSRVPGSCQSGFFTKSAVGDTVALTSTLVRLSFIFERASEPEVTTRSQPSTRSAAPVPTRTEWSSPGEGAILTCDITGPNFWASPLMSSTVAPLPSRCAAIATIWPMVITPMPPIPVTRMPNGRSRAPRLGCGRTANSVSPSGSAALPFFRVPPSTVTKLGQNPFRQE